MKNFEELRAGFDSYFDLLLEKYLKERPVNFTIDFDELFINFLDDEGIEIDHSFNFTDQLKNQIIRIDDHIFEYNNTEIGSIERTNAYTDLELEYRELEAIRENFQESIQLINDGLVAASAIIDKVEMIKETSRDN